MNRFKKILLKASLLTCVTTIAYHSLLSEQARQQINSSLNAVRGSYQTVCKQLVQAGIISSDTDIAKEEALIVSQQEAEMQWTQSGF